MLIHTLTATLCLLGSLLFQQTAGASSRGATSATGLIAFIDIFGQLYTIKPDGTGKKLIRSGYDPDWSPDGTQLAFANPVFDFEVAVMNADGSGVHNLTNNNVRDTFPAWSPDGSQIAFYSERGPIGVWLMNADGSNPHFLSDGILANWSPDGSKIIFQTSRDGNSEIYTMNPDGSDLTNLTNNPVEDTVPCYSPNGSRISFRSDRDGNGKIYLMDPDGNNQVRLTDTPEDEDESSWSSDGTQIAFQSLHPPAGIYTMNSDGTDQTFPNSDGGGRPDWQPVSGGDLTLASAASRKFQGGQAFDVNLPLTGPTAVEPRGGANEFIVFTFSSNVTAVDGTTSSCGTVVSTTIDSSDAHNVIVQDTGACDQQDVTITLNGVHDDQGNTLDTASATVGLLLGDVNGDRAVSQADAQEVRSHRQQRLTEANFRDDVNISGAINIGDVRVVILNRGHTLP